MARDRRPYRGYLTRRRNRWALKLAVPQEIVESGRYLTKSKKPRTSVVRILEAKTHSEALAEAAPLIIEMRALFTDIMKGLPVSDYSASKIASATGHEAYDRLIARRHFDRGRWPDLANELATLAVFGDIHEPNPLLFNATTADYARQQLAKLKVPPTQESVEKLADLILAHQREAVDAVRAGQRLPDMPMEQPVPKPRKGAVEIEPLAEQWLAESEYTDKGKYQHRRKLAVLCEHHNTAGEIDRRAAGDFVTEVLAKRNTGRKGRTVMSAVTIGSYLTTYARLWHWLERRGHVESNPWTNQRMDRNGEDDVEGERRGFTEDEGGKLLAAMQGADRDVASIAAVSGMRLEEIAALDCEDATVEKRVVWLTVREGKTDAAARRVPVVAAVVRKMLARRKAAGKGRLFPELKADRFGDYSHALSKRAGRKLRAIGLTDPVLVAEHSWRHRARTLMERAEVAPWVADWVLGHERPGEGLGRYSEGPSDTQLVEAMRAVTLPSKVCGS
jgi:integrase